MFAGVYAQDEWKLTSQLTLNFGARFDVYSSSFDAENQLSPRVNLVYQPFDGTTLHAGYARYFTPPPVEAVSGRHLGQIHRHLRRTRQVTRTTPVKAERANYYDAGISQTILPGWNVGLDGYYKTAQQQLDDGLFGQTLILSAFNYEKGRVYGLEFTTSYQTKGFPPTPTPLTPSPRVRIGTRRSFCSLRRSGLRPESLDLSGPRPGYHRFGRRVVSFQRVA